MLLASLVATTSVAQQRDEPVAARLGEQALSVADVDRRCGEKCATLRAAIDERESATLDALIDEALLATAPAPTPTAKPVTVADVERYLAEHAVDFDGPPERDRAAVRFFLERDRSSARSRRRRPAPRTRGPRPARRRR